MRRSQGQAYDEAFPAINEVPAAVLNVSSAPYEVPVKLPIHSWRYRYVKRGIDILGGLVMLAIFLVPGLIIALAILLTSPYPVFYSEERIGRNGTPFRIWKFRSMRPHARHRTHSDGVVLQWRMDKRLPDPRVTTIGRFLRRWSIDECPQILNVLRGDMSLVGPRPVVKAETYYYKNLLSFYLSATPGLSGLWQVSGRSDLDFGERAGLDATYVQNWSLTNDLKILLRTIPAVLGRVGAR
jgi:exopolysaccharide production protein ExoY